MALLTRKADYALLILSYLHQHPGVGTARTIAEHYALSKGFVANILKELCSKGFVRSTRGIKGGYVVLRPFQKVTLAELLESLEERFHLATCTGHEDLSAGSPEDCSVHSICPIKGPMFELHDRLMDVFRGVTLADLLNPHLPIRKYLPLVELPSCGAAAAV